LHDLDGDGDLDLVVAVTGINSPDRPEPDNRIAVYRNRCAAVTAAEIPGLPGRRLIVQPSPARSEARLFFAMPMPGEVNLQIVALNGRILWERRSTVHAGDNTIALAWPSSQVGPGVHFVRVQGRDQTFTGRLLVLP
jgi:hypothetical protein